MNFLEAMRFIVENPDYVAEPLIETCSIKCLPAIEYGTFQTRRGFYWLLGDKAFIPEPELLFAEWRVLPLIFVPSKNSWWESPSPPYLDVVCVYADVYRRLRYHAATGVQLDYVVFQ
jgi:hypothetical protein